MSTPAQPEQGSAPAQPAHTSAPPRHAHDSAPSRREEPSRAGRAYAYGVSAGMVALMLFPLFRSPPVDSFPLSTYPMFSRGRSDATTVVERAVGVDSRGGRRPIPPRLVGSDEVLQAKATLAHSIRRGARAARALCRDIAARAARDDAFADLVTVEIRTDTFDGIAFFEGREAPIDAKVHATCKVGKRR